MNLVGLPELLHSHIGLKIRLIGQNDEEEFEEENPRPLGPRLGYSENNEPMPVAVVFSLILETKSFRAPLFSTFSLFAQYKLKDKGYMTRVLGEHLQNIVLQVGSSVPLGTNPKIQGEFNDPRAYENNSTVLRAKAHNLAIDAATMIANTFAREGKPPRMAPILGHRLLDAPITYEAHKDTIKAMWPRDALKREIFEQPEFVGQVLIDPQTLKFRDPSVYWNGWRHVDFKSINNLKATEFETPAEIRLSKLRTIRRETGFATKALTDLRLGSKLPEGVGEDNIFSWVGIDMHILRQLRPVRIGREKTAEIRLKHLDAAISGYGTPPELFPNLFMASRIEKDGMEDDGGFGRLMNFIRPAPQPKFVYIRPQDHIPDKCDICNPQMTTVWQASPIMESIADAALREYGIE